MELEFDKEMNAILRKARDSGTADAAPATPHVDADAIAAFVENALPDKARQLYLEHFADCGPCRTMLSNSISSMETEGAIAAPSVAAAPVEAAVIPWYERLFRTPNMAIAMGALVLAFTGLLGYVVIERTGNGTSTDVARVSDSEPRLNGPSYDPNSASTAANANASTVMPAATALPAANAVANTMAASNAAANKPAIPSTSGIAAPADAKRSDETAGAAPGSDAPRPVMAAPPPPAVSQPSAAANERKAEPSKLKDDSADGSLAKTEMAENRNNDAAKPMAKRAAGGPRNSIQLQQQESNAMGSGVFENSSRKHVGGKTFDRRNGAWYDTAYHGHPTQNYRRGTDEYKKLDAGLRSIADSIGGTVVIVWKEKSYRIQ